METQCLEWQGATAGNGYGVKCVQGKMTYVHRLSAIEKYGEIPAGMVVAHKCDNPKCYNPDHLVICTQAQNLADMRSKGRSAKGEKHRTQTHPELVLKGEGVGTHKLTEREVLEIRGLYEFSMAGKKSDFSLASLAGKYGVAFQTIHKIIRRKTWKHL
jgi:hypothetical protein